MAIAEVPTAPFAVLSADATLSWTHCPFVGAYSGYICVPRSADRWFPEIAESAPVPWRELCRVSRHAAFGEGCLKAPGMNMTSNFAVQTEVTEPVQATRARR
jgi:hypothetical protein